MGADTDFAFFTPQAVRNDVRMTGFNVTLSNQLTSRLGLNAMYMRTHFEGPDGDVRLGSPSESERKRYDQNRDWFGGKPHPLGEPAH